MAMFRKPTAKIRFEASFPEMISLRDSSRKTVGHAVHRGHDIATQDEQLGINALLHGSFQVHHDDILDIEVYLQLFERIRTFGFNSAGTSGKGFHLRQQDFRLNLRSIPPNNDYDPHHST